MKNHTYYPDNWVVLKITLPTDTVNPLDGQKENVLYKVLGGWEGGYLNGDTWRMNSGITGVEKQAHRYGFYGSSGSVYWCHQGGYCLTSITSGVYNKLKENFGDAVELMPKDTKWGELEGL